MNILFFDDKTFDQLLPLTFTKPSSELRTGIFTIREKWENLAPGNNYSYITREYLSPKFQPAFEQNNIIVSGSLIPDKDTVEALLNLGHQEVLMSNDRILGIRADGETVQSFNKKNIDLAAAKKYRGKVQFLDHPWQIFQLNGDQISADLSIIRQKRKSHNLSSTNRIIGNDIFIEEGVKAEFATINAETGPVYLGKNSEVMEGSVIRGPFALCEGSVLKLLAKIYGPTTIGPFSKVGGEVNNSVIQGYSNKAHDGFLGNSVIGEWCNLGADTNNSNLKNNYAEVRLWSYPEEKFINTGLQFCGLIMGDHSKCGINTMFNTGTVVGVNANIFGSGFPRNFIPSFSWGGAHGFTTYSISKALEVAALVMERKGVEFDSKEQSILQEVYKMSEKYRK